MMSRSKLRKNRLTYNYIIFHKRKYPSDISNKKYFSQLFHRIAKLNNSMVNFKQMPSRAKTLAEKELLCRALSNSAKW